jgi:uncharacterized protein YdeI (YjbR/CyaY-like superfamily)
MNPKVDFYFNKDEKWQQEIIRMRMIALDTGLNEELKWGTPCYMLKKSNVVLIHVFKDYCAFLFFKGALLNDTDHILIQPTENVQASRQIRFTSIEQLIELEPILKTYIHQAIEIEKAGLKVELKKVSDFAVAEEFQYKLDAMPELKTAFEALTLGRKKGYYLYFAAAKQSKTRQLRVEKCIPQILNGKGLDD